MISNIQYLRFSKSNFDKIRTGKRSTVRLRQRSYYPGAVTLHCPESGSSITAEILTVEHIAFGALTNAIIQRDGFNSLNDLKSELEHCYQQVLQNSTEVTVVQFELIGDSQHHRDNL